MEYAISKQSTKRLLRIVVCTVSLYALRRCSLYCVLRRCKRGNMSQIKKTRKMQETDFIDEIYELRLGYDPNFIMPNQLIEASTVRALTEMRMYHLPPYFLVPSITKSKLCSQSGTCYHLDDNINSVERETFYNDSYLFANRTRARCTICSSTRGTKNGICYHCVAIEAGLSPYEERELSKEYNKAKYSAPCNWTAPKKMLLARELGCLKCGLKLSCSHEDIWLGPEIPFHEGLCDECSFPAHEVPWNVHPEPYHTPHKNIPHCLVCNSKNQYALWGMCIDCYYEWSLKMTSVLQGAELLLVHASKEDRQLLFRSLPNFRKTYNIAQLVLQEEKECLTIR